MEITVRLRTDSAHDGLGCQADGEVADGVRKSHHAIDVDGRGPAILLRVERSAAAEERDIPAAADVNVSRLTAWHRASWQALSGRCCCLFERAHRARLDLIVRRLETHLSTGGADVRAKVNPRRRALDQIRALLEKRIEPIVTELVPARCNEQNRSPRPAAAHRADAFDPARNTSTSL
jgi:hypothetical protein